MQKHHAKEIVALECENAHLWEAHMSWQPEANLPKGGKAKSTTVSLPRATNMSVHLTLFPRPSTLWERSSHSSRTSSSLASWRRLFLPIGRTWLLRNTMAPQTQTSTWTCTSPRWACTPRVMQSSIGYPDLTKGSGPSLVHRYDLCNFMVYSWIGKFLFGRLQLLNRCSLHSC